MGVGKTDRAEPTRHQFVTDVVNYERFSNYGRTQQYLPHTEEVKN